MTGLSKAALAVRRYDPDRFFAALLAPSDRREALMLLYAFNHELARAREVASEPMVALIRLQWWREVVEGARRPHELAGPLADGLDRGLLAREDLLAVLDGRELEAESPPASMGDFQDYVRATAGALAVAAGRALGGSDALLPRLGALGSAYGVAGQLRNVASLARQGRCVLPQDVLAAAGLTSGAVIARPNHPALMSVRRELAAWGLSLLREGAGPVPRACVAAALPAVLARRDFRHLDQTPRPRGIGDRLAMLGAAMLGRV